MAFDVHLKDDEFALAVGAFAFKDATLIFSDSPDDEKDVVMQINLTFTPEQKGPGDFTIDNEFGVFKIGGNMFADGVPHLTNKLVSDNQMNFISDGLNIATKGDKKEHHPALKRKEEKEEKGEYSDQGSVIS